MNLKPQEYEHKIIDDYVEFYLYKRDGTKFTCYIDLIDWDKFKSYPYRWHVSKHNLNHYISSTTYTGIEGQSGRGKTVLLHNYLFEYDEKHRPDHIDHNGLNNRRYNIRIIEVVNNLTHRQCRNKNNKSGYRNVFWDKRRNKWIVVLMISGKHKFLGAFENVHEAGEHAIKMRNKYYGKEFSGES